MITEDIYIRHSQTEGIIAKAGGGQALATELTATLNIVDTVATTGNSCKTDTATVGKIREVINAGANDLYLYPKIGERFKDGVTLLAINEPITISPGNGFKLRCFSVGIFRF